MVRSRAAIAAFILVFALAFTGHAEAATFSDAYGTFQNPTHAIDADRGTFAEATGKPYRGEYFLIVRFSQRSLIRNLKIRYDGKEPKGVITEMGEDGLAWRPYELGEKSIYMRIRFAAKEGEIFKIAEVEANSEAAPAEAFAPTILEAGNIETTAAVISVGFTKPARLSVSYGLSPTAEELKNFTEYTSYQPFYQIRLRDLVEGLEYFVRVKAISADGDVYVTEDTAVIRFSLLGTPPLKVVSSGVGYVSPRSFSVVLQTNIPSHCVFYFGEPDYFSNIVSEPGFDTRHVFEFKDLRPQHLYAYMPVITDHRGMNVNVGKQHITTAVLNIAKGKRVVEGTFTALRNPEWQGGGQTVGDTVLQRITDGNTGFFKGMAHSGNVGTADQYAVIDLGREYTMESHSTVWRALAYPQYYEIFTSQDNKTWVKQIVMSEERIGRGQSIRSGDGDPLHVTGSAFERGVKARYVKILVPRGSKIAKRHREWTNVDLAEVMIFPGGEYDEIKRIVREEWRP